MNSISMRVSELHSALAAYRAYTSGMEGPLDGLGPGLAVLREKRGLSVEELGVKIGIDGSGVRKLESVGANPQASTLSRHLMHLNAGLRDLACAIEHATGKEPPATVMPEREPTDASMGVALSKLPPDVTPEERRRWALLHDDEMQARVERHRFTQELESRLAAASR